MEAGGALAFPGAADYAGRMSRKLPFVGRIFWKVLAVVVVLVVVAWALVLWLTDDKIEPQDYGGTIICTILFAYLVHLWLLPPEDLSRDEGSPPDDESSSEDETPADRQ